MAEKNARLAIRRTIDRETPTIDLCETINSTVFAVDVVDTCEMYFSFFFLYIFLILWQFFLNDIVFYTV